MSGSYEAVKAEVLERIRPADDERERLDSVVDTLLERTRTAIADLELNAEVRHVGSTARDTWMNGELDIDIFVRFPPDLPREVLEREGLAVGHEVLPEGREEYAEHPYVTGEFRGFDVDLVPCYAVESAREIATSVDRTPFHDDYVEERLTSETVDEVRVLKQFLIAIGAYGSDLETRGFSGYLTELLVLEFETAQSVFEAASDWQPPVELDPEDHGESSFDAPLVVVDPTDPERNVAAVVSPANVARVQHYSRELLATPTVDLFFPETREPLAQEEVEAEVASRRTHPIALVFETPDLVTDQLYPQLRKSLQGIGDALERNGFDVLRQAAFADERSVLLFELEVYERPAVQRHLGPPVAARDHADRFLSAYSDSDVYGPFIDGDRYIVERDRSFTEAAAVLRSPAVFDARLGPAVEAALDSGYEVLVAEEIGTLAREFGVDLARYFEPKP